MHYENEIYSLDWAKWRYSYIGGTPFILRYLKRYSDRESDTDFANRKEISYSPSFAKAAVNEIRNSIYERMGNISRKSTSNTYNLSVEGLNGGVDYASSSMNYFIGTKILPELLVMAKVAIVVDNMPFPENANYQDTYKVHPYLYYYCRESIIDWECDKFCNLTSITLEDNYYDEKNQPSQRNRTYELVDGQVKLTLQDTREEYLLNIPKIPVVISSISNSLMEDIADYQIALLNLASSDMSYTHKSNFPFYVEQFNPMMDFINNQQKLPLSGDAIAADPTNVENQKPKDINVGGMKGRRYPTGVEHPQFINPSIDPLKISMEKQEQLKKEIRALVNLTLANMTMSRTSAESKQQDVTREETGLSYVGLELQATENKILELWNMYEKNTSKEEYVFYPTKYSLKTAEQLLAEGNELIDHAKTIASPTYRKEIAKIVVKNILDSRVQSDVLDKINKEIDKSDFILSEPELLNADVESGLVTTDLASEVRGYPVGEAKKAAVQHLERLKAIAISQSDGMGAARGVPTSPTDNQGKTEKQNSRNRDNGPNKSKVRGKGQ